MKKVSADERWDRARRKSAKGQIGTKGKRTGEIERLLAQEKWSAARRHILDELLVEPTNHWLWMHLSLTYYEQRQYGKALNCARRAVELQPGCPLALWHYAGALSMEGEVEAALAIYVIIQEIGLETIAHGECGEGMDWAMQLLNDVHYRMGLLYQWLEKDEPARVSFEKYLHNRSHGVGSIYNERDARKHLASLPGAKAVS